MADPANAVEAAALLVEAVDAGTAVEAMRIVFSATASCKGILIFSSKVLSI